MDLPNLFSAQKNSDTPERVIGILLSQTKVQALLLSISNTHLEAESSSDIIEYTDIKNCLLQTDEALQQLGKESESVDTVVFGLDHDWVHEGEVVDQHKPLLRQLTTELALKPVGFIDTSEALVQHYLAQNSLYSGILVLFSTTALTVSYVSQGKVKGIEQVGRSDSVVADLREGLARFSKQVADEQFYLPAKLSLASFDLTEDELQEMQQDLLEFNWTEHARFLQIPTIEVVNDEQFTAMAAHEAARAAAIASGFYSAAATRPEGISAQSADATSKEMGFTEVSPSQNEVQTQRDEEKNMNEEMAKTVEPVGAKQETAQPEPETAEPESATANNAAAQPQETSNVSAVPAATASSFGVPISSDKIVNSNKSLDELDKEAESEHPAAHDPKAEPVGFIARLRSRWNEPYKGNRSLKFFILTGFGSGLVVLALVLFGLVYFTAQAEVVVKAQPLPVSKDVVVTLDSEATEPDAENLILPGHSVTKTVSGQDTTAATGVAIVGDEAKGTATIYNKTTAEKTFDAGTVIANGDLEFTLDEEVTVASASVTEKAGGEEKEYGRADVAVTATDIGADYNLEEGAEFAVASFATDTYSAEAANTFSGGASREVQIVSADDRQRLFQDLRSSLIEEANEQFQEESGNGEYILSTSSVISESAEFSAEEEDEVTEFALNLEITVEALSYHSDDLKPIAAAVLASEIPDGYELSAEEPQILSDQTEDTDEDEATVALEANISSFAHPVLNHEELVAEIAGKQVETAVSELQNREEIEEARINWRPSFARLVRGSLPGQEKINLVIEI